MQIFLWDKGIRDKGDSEVPVAQGPLNPEHGTGHDSRREVKAKYGENKKFFL